jgi:predicted RNA-binding Zn-ribbon protein involved in translation (DUF1610 family)
MEHIALLNFPCPECGQIVSVRDEAGARELLGAWHVYCTNPSCGARITPQTVATEGGQEITVPPGSAIPYPEEES